MKNLAEKLIITKTETERKKLLSKISAPEKTELAQALKDVCYANWTSEPTKAQKSAIALKSLEKLDDNPEIKAVSCWVSGISDLTKGKLESAVKNFDYSEKIFIGIEKKYDAAQTQVAKLIALAMLGRYVEAIDAGKNALRIFEKYDDELAAGKIEKNLGNIVARQGDEISAEKYYLSARERFIKIGDISELTMSDNSLANTYAELNNFQKAEKFYSQALKNARTAKMKVTEAEIEASMGNLALFRGNYSDALRLLELSRQKYETLEMPHQQAIAKLEIADIYAELNLSDEAFEIYEEVSETLKKLKMRGEEARARANFGRVAARSHKTNLAGKQLRKSADLYKLEKNPNGVAAVRLAQIDLELSRGKNENALQIVEETEKVLIKSENLRQKLMLKYLKAEAVGKLGRKKQAEKLLTETLSQANRQEQKNLAQIALNSLGILSRDSGAVKKAENYFNKAVKIIENLRAPLAAEEFRMAFLSDKLAPFENLAKIYLEQKKFKNAFLMIERSRARVLAENLGEVFSGEFTAKTPAKLANRIENLREELNWFYSRLNRAQEESEIGELQSQANKREKQIADVMRQIESVKTRSKKSKNSTLSINFKLLQKNLGGEKSVIEYVCFDGKFSAFVLTDKKIDFVKDLAEENEIISLLENLQFQFGALRYGATNLKSFENELKKRADAYLQKLYEKLFAPLEEFTRSRDLIVVPSSALHYVPFQALFDGEKYLIEMREISYAPSATVWNFLQTKRKRKTKNALLIGFADEKIPLVDNEIEQLKKIFAVSKSFTGDDAGFSAFTINAENFDVIHLACHGQFRPENPMFSSLRLADGWITVRDIYAQKLNAGLVTLSACETGLNKIFAGDEILGLARGFLSAGANSLVLSLWTVNDEATTRLMKSFYENLQRGESLSASLAQAQREFIDRKVHPYYWSPFVLIGK